ncbi:MAG: hypothetical protein ABH869_03925 [Candidatus Omnitrophota bacterium]
MFLVFSFPFQNTAFAVTTDSIQAPAVSSEEDIVLSVDDIGIAIDCGTIKSRHKGDSGKVIVHIQDAHCNFEAQSNINRILEQITRECGVRMISVEGAEGIVDTSWFRAFPDAEIRKEVATYFMKKGEIAGAEFFSINSDYEGTIFGAETRDYYIQNLKAFTDVYPYKDEIEKYFSGIKNIAGRLRGIIYHPALKEIDSKIREFDSKDLELSEFAEILSKKALKYKIDVKDCPNFKKLLDTLEYEQKIDFDVVDKERSDYIDALGKKLSKENMTELVTQSIKFKKGHIKAVDFYSHLRALAKTHNIPIVREYPNLFYYYLYTKLYDGIDNEGLFKEIDAVKKRIKGKLFKTDDQKKLDTYSTMLDMFVALVNIELTNEDYDLFKGYLKESPLENAVNYVDTLSQRYNLNSSIGEVPFHISENIPKMIDFYEIAMKRDKALIDNTLTHMKESGKDKCVLIAGGFHTRGIKSLLEKQGISYVVVTPKITKDVETPYIKVLTNQRTSLEDILTESAAMPGASSANSSDDMIIQGTDKFICPLLRVSAAELLFDKQGMAELVTISKDAGTVTGEDADTYKGRVEGLFQGAVERYTDQWLLKTQKQLDEIYKQKAKEKWEALKDDTVKGMFIRHYLDKARQSLVKASGDKKGGEIYKALEPYLAIALKARLKDTLGVQADQTVLTTWEAHKYYDELIVESIDEGREKEVPMDHIRKGALYLTHRGFFEKQINHKVPDNKMGNVHPGRGGEEKEHEAIQAHIDLDFYNALNNEQQKRLFRHELAHIDIWNVQEIVHKLGGITRVSQDTIRKAVNNEEAFRTWVRYVNASSPTGEAQETFVNQTLGYDVTGDIQQIKERILAQKHAEVDRKEKANEIKEQNVKELEEIVKAGKGVQNVLPVVNAGDESVIEKALKKVAPSIFGKNVNIMAHGEVDGSGKAARRGQLFGLLDAFKHATAVWEKKFKTAFNEAGNVVLGAMFPGKGTRLSPFTQSLFGIKPFMPVLIRTDKKADWLSGGEASLYSWNLAAYHLKRMGFQGTAWKWLDEPQIPSTRLADLNMDLSETDIIRFGSKVLVTDDLAKNKEWLNADEDGNFIAQVRRRERAALLKRLGVEDTKDARAMVHIGSPAFSHILQEEAVKIFGDWKGWADVDGYLIEGLTQDEAQWEIEYREEIKTAIKEVVLKYYSAGEEIDLRVIENKLFEKKTPLWAEDSRKDLALIENVLAELEEEKIVGQRPSGVSFDWTATAGTWDLSKGERETIKFKKPGMVELLQNHPDFYQACQDLKQNVEARRGSPLQIKVIDYGEDLYWGDIGQLKKLRQQYHIVAEKGPEADFARYLAKIDHVKKDKFGNIIVGKCKYAQDGSIRNSVLINSNVYGPSDIDNAVLVNTNVLNAVIRPGSVAVDANVVDLEMGYRAMAMRSISGSLKIKDDYVHTNMPKNPANIEEGFEDWFADSRVDVGADDFYKQARFGNPRSFEDQLALVRQRKISPEKIEKQIQKRFINPIKKRMSKKTLKFGTSGLRADDEDMTDLEDTINTEGFVDMLVGEGDIRLDAEILIGDDFRPSSPQITRAVAVGVASQGCRPVYCGKVPTQVLANYALRTGRACIMVTGSHTGFGTNGIKYYTSKGEVLKIDEKPILEHVKKARIAKYMTSWRKSMFTVKGLFKIFGLSKEQKEWLKTAEMAFKLQNIDNKAKEMYVARYAPFMELMNEKAKKILSETPVALWEQSAVIRDIMAEIYDKVGVNYKRCGRLADDEFFPLDTEKVLQDERILNAIAKEHEEFVKLENKKPFAITSADGDSDRPFLTDENGNFLVGNQLNLLAVKFLRDVGVKIDAVMLTESADESILLDLRSMGINVVQTKIGSPHIIKAMNDWRGKRGQENDLVLGWESNGGFLLGSDITIPNVGKIEALPTRDSMLPILSAILFAARQGISISDLIAKQLNCPGKITRRYEFADLIKVAEKYNMDRDDAFEWMQDTVKMFSPNLKDKRVVAFNFQMDCIIRLKGKNVEETFEKEADYAETALSKEDIAEWKRVKKLFQDIYTEHGFGKIVSIRILDGIKITFEDGRVSHLRPSSNAPEFRNYAQADSLEEAKAIVELGLNQIIPNMLEYTKQHRGEGSAGKQRATPGIYGSIDVKDQEAFKTAVTELKKRTAKGLPIKRLPFLRSAQEVYTWGQKFEESFTLELLGAKTLKEKVAIVRRFYDISESEMSDDEEVIEMVKVISELWVGNGAIDVGTGYDLPQEALSLVADEFFGKAHMDKVGVKSGITAKLLTSARPLSLQIHDFDEMIIPLEDGYAYFGLNKELSQDDFIKKLLIGDVSMFNRVSLKAGVPMLVTRGVAHAYGEVKVYEVKAVDAEGDKKGTISFFDRLKWQLLPEQEQKNLEAKVEQIVALGVEEDQSQIWIKELVDEGYIRQNKDFLTLSPERRKEIAAKVNLEAFNPVKLLVTPEIISDQDKRMNGRCQKMGETDGFVSLRYTIEPKKEISAVNDIVGKPHTLFILEGTVCVVNALGETIAEMGAGEEWSMPYSAGKYTLVALDKKAVVFTQYKPLKTEEEMDVMPVVLEKASEQEILTEEISPYTTTGKIDKTNRMVNETMTVTSVARPAPVMTANEHILAVDQGEVVIEVGGEVLMHEGKPAVFPKDTRIIMSQGEIVDSLGRVISASAMTNAGDYKLRTTSEGSALVDIRRDTSDAERSVYAVYRALAKHFIEIKEGLADLMLPKEIFVKGGKGKIGSAKWMENKINDFFNKRDLTKIHTFNSTTKDALKQIMGIKVRKGAVAILAATQESVDNADQQDMALQKFLNNIKSIPLPSLGAKEIENKGWSFAFEVVGTALLQTKLNAKAIENKEAIAEDMLQLMKQLSDPYNQRNLGFDDLYYLLSFSDDGIPKKIKEKIQDSFAWMVNLVKRLLLRMPITPFNAADALHSRRMVMYSL